MKQDIIQIPRGILEYTQDLKDAFLLNYLHSHLQEDGMFCNSNTLIKDFHLGMVPFRISVERWKEDGLLDHQSIKRRNFYKFDEKKYKEIEDLVEGNLLLDTCYLPHFKYYIPTTIIYSSLQYVLESELEEGEYVEDGYIQYRFPVSVLKDVFKMGEKGATLSYRKIKNIDPRFRKIELYGTK